ncbi:MAG TPA: dihydropteroate synthase [Clostridia bacterium]|nr:dihydropteroate synthase [Clostridia bacterium]
MLIVGNFGNLRFKQINDLIVNRKMDEIKSLLKEQVQLGVHYLNTGQLDLSSGNMENVKWFLHAAQEEAEIPLFINNPSPETLDQVLSLCNHGQPILNLVLAERKHLPEFLPFIKKYNAKVVGLLMPDDTPPESARQRIEAARMIVGALREEGVAEKDIYLDPFIKPICNNTRAGVEVLEAIRSIKQQFTEVNFICSISNISFGLPNSKLIDQTFLIQLMTAGMNAFILDPLEKDLRTAFFISRMLLGQDAFCREYLTAHWQGMI